MFWYIAQGLIWTALITVASFLLGSLFGIVVAAARVSSIRSISILARIWVDVVRSVPPLVWLFIVYFGLAEMGLQLTSLVAAIATFSVIASVYLGEIYRGGLAAIGRGQIEAAQSLGLGRIDTFVRILVPQVFRTVSPSMVTYGIGLMKDSALASTIGVVEMTFRANQVAQNTGKGLEAFLIVGAIYLAFSVPLGIWARHKDARASEKYLVA